jgi:quercetin dioxygenase-like cupin family protein
MGTPLARLAKGENVFSTGTRQQLDIVTWAGSSVADEHTDLRIEHAKLPFRVHDAPGASGLPLVSNGTVGADLLQLAAGSGFVPHTHPGHHILLVVAGVGTITYDGRVHETHAGQTYLIEGAVPHAVGAITDHLIVAVGAPHRAVDADDRMAPVPYEEVIAADGDLACMICDLQASAPTRLHATGCPHCPCPECAVGDHR